jgi:Arc/MetJ-type ribon-helix-helix transcriptional regulator
MRKTTIYLPDDLKRRIEKVARTSRKSEADVIRDAINAATRVAGAPVPRIPLVNTGLGDATIAENVDALLESFGR